MTAGSSMAGAGMARGVAGTDVVLGVDIGGTFTDVVAYDAGGDALYTGKVLTDYQDLARGVMAAIAQVMQATGMAAGAIARVVHGTTLVTNSLIERRGVRTALIATQGFADVLELARESRHNIYDIDLDVTPPIVPRELVWELDERMLHTGQPLRAPQERAIAAIADELRGRDVASVAVCLLHSYANPAHEQRVREVLRMHQPRLDVCLSSETMPDIREYERANTTAANAYVRPVIEDYLKRLRAALDGIGLRAELLIMTSDGGLVDVATAARFPVRLTESGPAGGASAASYIGRISDMPALIAYDMGGTTAKVCVIDGGEPTKSNSFEFGRSDRFARGSGLPLQIPVVEMIEIGAGGGSIAHVNEIGMLQVGPHSANASPGPACYGLGGRNPTVTDADLVLGYIGANSFLGGAMRLDEAAARAAIERGVGGPMGVPVEEAAWSIHRVVNANMARAAKVHCLEQGKDVRRFAMFPYGGAGPIHAYGVARTLGVRDLLYPLRAGVLSAFGFLVAEPSFEVLRGSLIRLDEPDFEALNAMLAQMEAQARAVIGSPESIAIERAVAVRYRGQSFELYVPIGNGAVDAATIAALERSFGEAYRQRYHLASDQPLLDAVRWRVRATAVGRGARPSLRPSAPPRPGSTEVSRSRVAVVGERRAWVPERNAYADVPVYDRYALQAGASFQGPAIIEEPESTVFIGADGAGVVDPRGGLRVRIGAPAAYREEQ
jgi:N-methylhydantoinase A